MVHVTCAFDPVRIKERRVLPAAMLEPLLSLDALRPRRTATRLLRGHRDCVSATMMRCRDRSEQRGNRTSGTTIHFFIAPTMGGCEAVRKPLRTSEDTRKARRSGPMSRTSASGCPPQARDTREPSHRGAAGSCPRWTLATTIALEQVFERRHNASLDGNSVSGGVRD